MRAPLSKPTRTLLVYLGFSFAVSLWVLFLTQNVLFQRAESSLIDERGFGALEEDILRQEKDPQADGEAEAEIDEKRSGRFRERGPHGSNLEAENKARDCVVRRTGAAEQLRIEEEKHLPLCAQIRHDA